MSHLRFGSHWHRDKGSNGLSFTLNSKNWLNLFVFSENQHFIARIICTQSEITFGGKNNVQMFTV